jgi:hypothetical protein
MFIPSFYLSHDKNILKLDDRFKCESAINRQIYFHIIIIDFNKRLENGINQIIYFHIIIIDLK